MKNFRFFTRPCLFLNISSAIRKNFLLVNIPDLFHIGTDGLIKYFLSVNLCFYITGCRMNLSHLRIFIHIWSFRPDCFVSILTADLFVLDPPAEISDIFFAFISFENDFISFNSKLFYQNNFSSASPIPTTVTMIAGFRPATGRFQPPICCSPSTILC